MEAFITPLRILTLSGLLPHKNPPIFQKIRGIFFYYLNILFVFSTIIEIWNDLDDYSALSGQLSVVISVLSYLLKIMVFRMNKDYFYKLMEMMKITEFQDYPNDMEPIVTKSVKIIKLITVVYAWSCGIVIVLYFLMPLIENIDLPIAFSYDVGPYRPAVYAFQVIGDYKF